MYVPQPPLFLNTFSRWSALAEVNTREGQLFVTASAQWPTANLAVYVPFFLRVPYPIKRFFVVNGATVSGNWDVGVFSDGGTKIVSTGSTAQSGASAPQYVSKEHVLRPGSYYLAMSVDNTTARFFNVAPTAISQRVSGLLGQASAFALPSTMTPAAITSTYVPMFGFTLTASGF